MTANADMTPTVGEGRHLPECDTPHNGLLPCICESLRACEQRVLDAARKAVAKEAEQGPLYSVRKSGVAQRGWDAMSRHALAAIDALRGES